jgi:hypothetical protein
MLIHIRSRPRLTFANGYTAAYRVFHVTHTYVMTFDFTQVRVCEFERAPPDDLQLFAFAHHHSIPVNVWAGRL